MDKRLSGCPTACASSRLVSSQTTNMVTTIDMTQDEVATACSGLYQVTSSHEVSGLDDTVVMTPVNTGQRVALVSFFAVADLQGARVLTLGMRVSVCEQQFVEWHQSCTDDTSWGTPLRFKGVVFFLLRALLLFDGFWLQWKSQGRRFRVVCLWLYFL